MQINRVALGIWLSVAVLSFAACGKKSGGGDEVCGNDRVGGTEECDGADLDGESCADLGLIGGPLACDSLCSFDVSGCTGDATCGNGTREYPEDCDATDLAGATCASEGFGGGTLTCDASCGFDYGACIGGAGCGDGNVSAPEVCDGSNLDGETCASLGYPGGTLACAGNCRFDESGCGECQSASDCDAIRGAPPCGVWACSPVNHTCEASSPGCTDGDQDGYGAGAACACAALDCDDSDPTIGDNAQRSCYSGPGGTAGVGTCRAGLETCTGGGGFGPCVGEVTPSGEACNGEDDDCNGVDDDGLGTFTCGLGACVNQVPACQNGVLNQCVPLPGAALDQLCDGIDEDCDGAVDEDCATCVPVATNGNDTNADGTFTNPFQTIQAAIDYAAANSLPTVCVSGGANCGNNGTYASLATETIVMANGVSVLGSYERTNWTRCTGITTTIQPQTPEGVTFGAGVMSLTVLDGFRVDRFSATTTAAITVDGAQNVIISGVDIQNTPAVTNSYAINIINGGDATITRGHIDAGEGSSESIAVRVVGARATLENNCASLDANGRCDDFCFNNPSIRGRITPGTGVTYGVLLQDASGSIIRSTAICGNDADQGAGVRIEGNSAGIIIQTSLINAWGGLQDSHGIWMEDCGGAAPWIVDNFYIASGGDNDQTRVDGIRAIGDCHPVIDGNVQITGGGEGGASNTTGVYCGMNTQGVTSRCVVLGNLLIEGSDFGFPPTATGVRCDDGGCVRIAGNVITGRGGVESYGVWLGATGTVVENNRIRGGCSPTSTGLHAEDSWAQIQNNFIIGYDTSDCGPVMGNLQTSYGAHILVAAGANEVVLHSNSVDGGGTPGVVCTGYGLSLDVLASAPLAGSGTYRNNIVGGGRCTTTYVVYEADVAADPRTFESNDLDPAGAPLALYYDEAATALMTAAGVDGLGDMIVSGTLSVDPLYVSYPLDLHLMAGSLCQDAGTTTGAPAADIDGQIRDVTPDIGADEL